MLVHQRTHNAPNKSSKHYFSIEIDDESIKLRMPTNYQLLVQL